MKKYKKLKENHKLSIEEKSLFNFANQNKIYELLNKNLLFDDKKLERRNKKKKCSILKKKIRNLLKFYKNIEEENNEIFTKSKSNNSIFMNNIISYENYFDTEYESQIFNQKVNFIEGISEIAKDMNRSNSFGFHFINTANLSLINETFSHIFSNNNEIYFDYTHQYKITNKKQFLINNIFLEKENLYFEDQCLEIDFPDYNYKDLNFIRNFHENLNLETGESRIFENKAKMYFLSFINKFIVNNFNIFNFELKIKLIDIEEFMIFKKEITKKSKNPLITELNSNLRIYYLKEKNFEIDNENYLKLGNDKYNLYKN